MGIRDILVTLVVLGCIPYILKTPYIGILVWSWLSYMNPHRLAWGFAYDFPFAQIVAIVLFISMLCSKESLRLPIKGVTVVWIIFLIWMGITTVLAYYPENAEEQYLKVMKIQLLIFATTMLINDFEKLNKLIWVIVLSIGFYSVKGGLFTLFTGGEYHVFGPAGFIEDNNALAVAILMIIPLMIYLYQTQEKNWIKNGLLVAIILSLFTSLGSQSRGALLALTAVGAFFWSKSKRKTITAIALLIMGTILYSFMPESWHTRMQTISTYKEDGSAMGRINAWRYSLNAANDNVFGLGFDASTPETFAIYAPTREGARAAHSIYFSVLADHGWIGLCFFLFIFVMTWRSLSKIIRTSKKHEELKEIRVLATMLKVGLIAYLSGGAFLSLAYFDLPWHLVSIMVVLTEFLHKKNICDRTHTTKIRSGYGSKNQLFKGKLGE